MSTTIESDVVKTSEIAVTDGFNHRQTFDEDQLQGLATSIKADGVKQPLIVARENGHFRLIDGERRLRAAKIAGIKEVPVVIDDSGDDELSSFISNEHHETLNPIEQAIGLQKIKEQEGLGTAKAIAERIGRKPAFVSSRLRLLALPEGCHEAIATGLVPIEAEKQLTKIAKVSPEIAVAITDLVKKEALDGPRIAEDPETALRIVAEWDESPGYVVDLSNSSISLGRLLGDSAEDGEVLFERADQAGATSDMRGGFYLRLEESDYDRLRAAGKLIEFKSEHYADQAFLVDAELGHDLAVQLVERAEAKAEERRAAEAAAAGVKPENGKTPDADAVAEAQRVQRRKEREEKEKKKARAEAQNDDLAARLIKRRGADARKRHSLNRVKVLARMVIGGNSEMPGSGIRLVYPQLRDVDSKKLKSGETRETVRYADSAKSRGYLLDTIDRAKTVNEVLEIMADALICTELANQDAVAMSNRIPWHGRHGVAQSLEDEIKEAKPKGTRKRK